VLLIASCNGRKTCDVARKNQLQARGRDYTVGPTIEDGCSLLRAAHGTANSEGDEAKYSSLNLRLALIASTIARAGIPEDVQHTLDRESLTLGSMFYGHEDNTHFTMAQINFASVGEDLREIGPLRGLHLEQNGDENYYTPLLRYLQDIRWWRERRGQGSRFSKAVGVAVLDGSGWKVLLTGLRL
jgi:hypothetical protein